MKPSLQQLLQYDDSDMLCLINKRAIPYHEEIVDRLSYLLSEFNDSDDKYSSERIVYFNYINDAIKHFEFNLNAFYKLME
jgi:hypothetical protein